MKKAPSAPVGSLATSPSTLVIGGTDDDMSVTIKLDEKKLKAVPPEWVTRWVEDGAFAASVRVLSLRNNQLRQLPPEIGHLKNLEALHLDNNQLTAWPEEMASLRKLKMLTFEGNDQLKELPFFDQFPELRSLKVTRRVNYRIPIKVAAGGGDAILDYLRTIRVLSERLAPQKLVVSFDPKAHWIPDKDAPGCAECKVRFSVFTWRYHCDLCGKNFCFKELSPQKMPIPYLSLSPAEVCTDCHRCLVQTAPAFASSNVNRARIPQHTSDEKLAVSDSGKRSRPTTPRATELQKSESEGGQLSPRRAGDDSKGKEKGTTDDEDEDEDDDDENSSDDAEMDPRKLLEKWKIQSLAKLREETKRGIDLMKKEITEAKDRELRELRRETDILRAELVAEKRRKDRGKQREKIDREVQLQTELAKKKDEVAALQDKLSKANKGREQLQSKLRNIRESTKSMADLRRDSRRDVVAGTGDVQEVSRREELEAREKEVAERERELKERSEQLERARAEREAEVREKTEISSRITELAKMVEDERAKSERIEAEWSLARGSERVRREQEAKLNAELQERAELEQRERAKSEERLQALAHQLDAAQKEKRELEQAIQEKLNAKAAERESEARSESEAKEREWQRRESEAARKIDEEVRLKQDALQKLANAERELAEARAQRGEEEGEQMRQLRERIAQLQVELEQERAQSAKAMKALEAQLAHANGALTQAKNESDEREKRISSLLAAAEKERETAKSESEAARRQAEERIAEVERRSQEEKREWTRREDELRAALAEERKRKDDALETIESMTMDLDSARRDSQSITQRLAEEKRAALVEESAKAQALQATIDQLQGQLNEARSHGASATSAIEARLAAQAQALAAAQAEADQKARRATELEAEVDRLRAKSECDKSESEESAKSAAREHDAEKAKSADLQAKLAALEKELEQSRAQEAQKQASVDAVGQKLAALQSELLAKEQAMGEAREKQELLVAELKRVQSEAADHDKKVVELRESLDAATCRASQRSELEEETAKSQAELIEARRAVERTEQLLSQEREQRARFEHELEIAAQKLKATEDELACEQKQRRESESSSDAEEASVSVVAAEELAELQHKIGNLETLLEAMRDEVKRAHEAEEEADRFKESNEQELHELRELVKEKDNQLRRTRQRMNNRVSQLILGMEEGEGLEALRQQLDEKEKELEEAKAKAVEEGRIQLAKVMKLVEDKAKEMKKMKKQLKEVRKKSKTNEIELEKAQAKILLYEEQLQHEKNGLLGKEKMSLISKIEQLKTHELQLMEELSNMQSRKRAPSFSALPLLKGTTKAKLLGSLSAMPAEDAEQLKKEKKELKEKERKEKEDKKERKRKEKEKEKMQGGKDPKATTPRGLGKKADKKLPQNPVFGVSLEEIQQKDPSRTVPRVVERLVQYLEEHEVFETEGIFRKSGRNLSIDALRKEFDFAGQGKEDDVSLVDDESIGIHEVAGTLKLFLQMLPEPPLSYQLYNSYIALQDTFESLRREKTEQEAEVCREEYLASLVALLTQLPKANLDLLFYILKFCNKLSKSAEQTKMTSHNLSLIFSPSLCSPEVPDITYQTQMPKLGGMVKTMMDEVFAIEAAVCGTSSH